MDVGMILPRQDPGGQPLSSATLVESMVRLEEFEFGSAWITDSLGRGFPNPDPLTTLAVAAALTERLRLGTSILQLAIRNPVELAQRVMTTHLLAGDRLYLGVGAGSTRSDFDATGQRFEDRFPRFEQSLDTMRQLWNGETVAGARLDPFESTLGGPKLLVGSWRGDTWIPRAAREFHGWIASARKTSWTVIERGLSLYREAGGTWAVISNVVVDPQASNDRDDEDSPLQPCGLKTARDRVNRLRDLGFDEIVLRTWDHTDHVVGAVAEIANDR